MKPIQNLLISKQAGTILAALMTLGSCAPYKDMNNRSAEPADFGQPLDTMIVTGTLYNPRKDIKEIRMIARDGSQYITSRNDDALSAFTERGDTVLVDSDLNIIRNLNIERAEKQFTKSR